MKTKICSKCGERKRISQFCKDKYKKDNLNPNCKKCTKKYRDAHKNEMEKYRKTNKNKLKRIQKKKYEQNKEYFINYQKEYYKKNKEKALKYQKKYRKENLEKIKIIQKIYYKKNKHKITQFKKEYQRKRRSVDPLCRLKMNIRTAISNALKNKGLRKMKTSKIEKILECSIKKLKIHLEKQFYPWMNWSNRGLYNSKKKNYGWDVTYKRPLSKATTQKDVKKLSRYTNLKPLCSYVNRHHQNHKF